MKTKLLLAASLSSLECDQFRPPPRASKHENLKVLKDTGKLDTAMTLHEGTRRQMRRVPREGKSKR